MVKNIVKFDVDFSRDFEFFGAIFRTFLTKFCEFRGAFFSVDLVQMYENVGKISTNVGKCGENIE